MTAPLGKLCAAHQRPIKGPNPSLGATLIGSFGNNAPVAQLDRVPGFEPGGREFKSLRARQFIFSTLDRATFSYYYNVCRAFIV